MATQGSSTIPAATRSSVAGAVVSSLSFRAIVCAILFTALTCASPALAFPPYKTTDAETAGANAVEFRLGLLEIEKTGSNSERQTPLANLNFGMGPHFEINSELERQTLNDTTIGPVKPLGERGAFSADTVGPRGWHWKRAAKH